MRVKLVNPENAVGLIDPVTKRSPFVELVTDPETQQVTTKVIAETDVPDTNHWRRRILRGELVLVEQQTTPIGNAPVAPLTTRS